MKLPFAFLVVAMTSYTLGKWQAEPKLPPTVEALQTELDATNARLVALEHRLAHVDEVTLERVEEWEKSP